MSYSKSLTIILILSISVGAISPLVPHKTFDFSGVVKMEVFLRQQLVIGLRYTNFNSNAWLLFEKKIIESQDSSENYLDEKESIGELRFFYPDRSISYIIEYEGLGKYSILEGTLRFKPFGESLTKSPELFSPFGYRYVLGPIKRFRVTTNFSATLKALLDHKFDNSVDRMEEVNNNAFKLGAKKEKAH